MVRNFSLLLSSKEVLWTGSRERTFCGQQNSLICRKQSQKLWRYATCALPAPAHVFFKANHLNFKGAFLSIKWEAWIEWSLMPIIILKFCGSGWLRHGVHLTFYSPSSLDEAHRNRQWLGQYLVFKMYFSINYFSLKLVVWFCLLWRFPAM